MASLHRDERTGNWVVMFRWGKQYRRSCETKSKVEARAAKIRIEETIRLLRQGVLELPPDADPATWIMSGGKLNNRPQADKMHRFGGIADAYLEDQHGKADSTITTERIHIQHLKRIIGENTPLDRIDLKKTQGYVTRRTKEKHRGKRISGTTIRKEIATFRQIWDWARARRYVGDCPLYDGRKWAVKLPRPPEKEKFQTWEQIEKRIAAGADPVLWESLFLDEKQVGELLAHVEKTARHCFIHPMFVFCAYTGARRSEILKSEIGDFDFETGQIRLRERKRKRDKSQSFRIVPMHDRLRKIIKAWLAEHPGGQHVITADGGKMTPHTAHHHFTHTLADSKWEVLRGFHVLRHSFGSNLARSGKVARETIAAWMGHTTQEMMDHYQHLFPQDWDQQISVLS